MRAFPARLGWLPPVALLFAAGFPLRAWERRWAEPAGRWRSEQLAALAGQGGLAAVSGGLRAPVAGLFWLKANLAWERRDAAATTALIQLAVAADERPACFWLNGARMLAYDLPEWLPARTRGSVRRSYGEAQAHRALDFLEKGRRWHGADADIPVEMANIRWRRLGDLEGAAGCYRLAAGQPGAPYYAARLHGELLRELGRPREALAWLRQVLPTLPAGDPAARRGAVLTRIRALEEELGAMPGKADYP